MSFDNPKRDGDVLLCTKKWSFAVFGSGLGGDIAAVRCEIVEERAGGKVIPGKMLYQPFGTGRWGAAFLEPIPADKPANNPYTINLYSVDPPPPVPPLPDLPIDALHGIRLYKGAGPGITYPAANTHVSSTFTAYGDTDYAIQAASYMDNGTHYTGSTRQKNSTWWITFTGLPTGSGWTLHAIDTSGDTPQSPLYVDP